MWGFQKYRFQFYMNFQELTLAPSPLPPQGAAKGGNGGGAKINILMLTSTIMCGIKCRVFNSVDSKSG